MKQEKRKNKENLIGKIIYGFLLFMPLFAMAVTCAYAIFNKNAYKSYSGNNTIQTNYINTNSFELNNEYYFNIKNFTDLSNVNTMSSNQRIYFENINNLNTSIGSSYDFTDFGSIGFYKTSNSSMNIYCFKTNGDLIISFNTNSQVLSFSFYYLNNNLDTTLLQYTNIFYSINNLQNHYIDNVFYYSVDKVEQSNLFNWSKDTGMYTTVHRATELLGITNTFIPMLMSYWLLISVIYIIYDIALIGVHMVHNKIHDFENVM